MKALVRSLLAELQVKASRFVVAGLPVPRELATDMCEAAWLLREME